MDAEGRGCPAPEAGVNALLLVGIEPPQTAGQSVSGADVMSERMVSFG